MIDILVGCCGWAVKGGKKAYYGKFRTIELQDTFYNLPKVETAEKWRREAPEDFVFCMKAWQAVTHPPTSPTWRRARVKIPKHKQKNYGNLQPTRENLEAWEKTSEIAKTLSAKVVILQTPASFGYSEENQRNAEQFFSMVKTDQFKIGWEPRGSWREHWDEVERICDTYGLIHVVDPFRWKPLDNGSVFYFRLHGIGRGEVNYSYRYTDDDLYKLKEIVMGLTSPKSLGYVMFNNVSMAEDAGRFLELLKG